MNIDGKKLSVLRFADNVVLTTEGVEVIDYQLNTVNAKA